MQQITILVIREMTGIQVQVQASPWESVSKMQSAIDNLKPGDRILFERGSIWYEVELRVNYLNGSDAEPIEFGAYGEGNKPILSGGKRITEFTKSGNMYSAPVDLEFPHGEISVATGVLIDNKWPDVARSEEFLTQGTNSNTSLKDETQNWETNELAGSYLLVQPVRWSWDASPIISNTSDELVVHPMFYKVTGGVYCGYYIANNDNYLDSDGEWTFKNKTLKIYHSSDLTQKNVQFAIKDSIIGILHSSI